MSAITRATLYHLVDTPPESELATAAHILEALRAFGGDESAYTVATAPLDDEVETEEERVAVAEARAELARGAGIAATEVYRRFGA